MIGFGELDERLLAELRPYNAATAAELLRRLPDRCPLGIVCSRLRVLRRKGLVDCDRTHWWRRLA